MGKNMYVCDIDSNHFQTVYLGYGMKNVLTFLTYWHCLHGVYKLIVTKKKIKPRLSPRVAGTMDGRHLSSVVQTLLHL